MSFDYFSQRRVQYILEKLKAIFDDKVDKVNGKDLSTNDFTDAYKTKLDGVASGAEVNVQSDWNQSDDTADDFIKNKPTISNNKVTQENTTSSSHYRVILSHSSDDADETDKVRKSGGLTYQASTGSLEVSNIHSETTTQMASVEIGNDTPDGTAGAVYGRLRLYGKNDKKVNITVSDDISASRDLVLPNKSGTVALTSDLPAAQVNSDWNASSGVAEILNKPTIPTVNDATLTIQKNGTTVETFTANASSNKTANITVPTKVSDLTNDSGFVTTDNKVQQNTISTSTQYYRPLLSSTYGSYTTDDETNTVKKSDNLVFRPGNASNASWLQLKHIHSVSDTDSLASILSIGHAASTTSGSETGASHGALRIYGKNGYYVGISDNYGLVDNSNRGLYLANRQGIIPTTNLIATDESPLTDVSGTMKRVASKVYSTGDHFIINNYYCRATEDIAKNAELIKNSNYVEETDLVSTIPTKVSDLTNDSGFTTLTLGTTSSTAYRGDRGASAYAHAVTNKGSAFSSGLYKITTNSEGHVTAATSVEKSDITALGIPGSDTDTHRPIQVNGTQVLGNDTTALNLAAGSNVTLSNNSGTVTIAATDTTYESKSASSGGTALSLVTTGEKYTWNNKITADTGWAYNVFGISRTTTKDEDESARITFRTYDNTDTQNILTNYSYIRAYSPHSGSGGNNLVINPTGRLYLGSGEFAQNMYNKHYNEADSSKALTGEGMYIGSDSNIYFYCNAGTLSSRKYMYLGSNDTYGFRLTPGSVALNESSVEVVTTDNVGSIGSSTNRWAAGYFVGLTSTDLTITNINGVAVGSTPEFTDYKTQIGKSTANTNRLVMLSAAYDSSSETKTVSSLYYDSALTYNPSTDTLKGFKNLNTTSDDFYLNGTSSTTFKVCVTSDSTASQMTGLLIGNSKNASAGCSHGVLQIYSRSDKYVRMYDRKIGSTNNDGAISANRNYYFPNKDGYLQVGFEFEDSITVSNSTSGDTITYTFTSSDITTTSAIDVYYSNFGVNPMNVTVSSGSCTVTFPKPANGTHTCRIYVKP